MTTTPRGISLGLVRPTRGVDDCRALGLGCRVRGRSTGNRLIEEPVENSEDSEFDDLEDLGEGPSLGLREEPRSRSIIYVPNARE